MVPHYRLNKILLFSLIFLLVFSFNSLLWVIRPKNGVDVSIFLHSKWFKKGPQSPELSIINQETSNTTLVVAGLEGIYLLDGRTGDEIWYINYSISSFFPPIVTDINNDNIHEIIIPNDAFGLIVVDIKGEIKQVVQLNQWGWISSNLIIIDLDGDGYKEIIVGLVASTVGGFLRGDGCILVLNCNNGSVLWIKQYGAPKSLYLIDFDNDDELELLAIMMKGEICIIDPLTGEKEDEVVFPSMKFYYFPIIYDFDDDGFYEIVEVVGNNIIFIDDEKIKWFFGFLSKFMTAYPISVDLNMDGEMEIIFCADNILYVISPSGKINWYKKLYGSNIFDFHFDIRYICAGDVNNDGRIELILIDDRARIHIIAPNGDTLLIKKGWFGKALLADIDGDNRTELIAYNYDGRIEAYEFSNPGYGSPWTSIRQDFNWTGAIADHDRDGLADYLEPYYHCDMRNNDSDSDGLIDGLEIKVGTDPRINDAGSDPDKDGLPNFLEIRKGTNLYDHDSDHDFINDKLDFFPTVSFDYLLIITGIIYLIMLLSSIVNPARRERLVSGIRRMSEIRIKLILLGISGFVLNITELSLYLAIIFHIITRNLVITYSLIQLPTLVIIHKFRKSWKKTKSEFVGICLILVELGIIFRFPMTILFNLCL